MTKPSTSTMVVAVADIAGFAKACRDKTDAQTFEMLNRFYNHAATVIARAQGQVVKSMGDAVLMVFPESQAKQAVASLHDLKATVQGLWSEFDAECRVRIHAHFGPVASGPIGPDQRFDVIGRTMNELFLMPWNGPEVSAELRKRIET